MHRKPIVHALIAARNEEKYLGKCLEALKKQSYPVNLIVVVDDGSSDRTAEIAKKYGAKVIRLKDRGKRVTGFPILAQVFNVGLKYLKKKKNDYVLIVSAKQVLLKDYVEQLVTRMESDEKLVIASGYIKNEKYDPMMPRGGGRLIKRKFLEEIGFLYPVIAGWESYIIFKANLMGYKTKTFRDILSYNLRPTSMTVSKCYGLGRSMKTLGYWWPWVFGRCIITFFKNYKCAFAMLRGYLHEKNKCDIASRVNELQRKLYLFKLKSRMCSLLSY
ncbi:MAG: glycosyltransferase [Candidatus Asgardarchaeia archaeon]